MVEQRVLLTGANGFVGAQVRKHLAKLYELHCTNHSKSAEGEAFAWHRLDLRDPRLCRALVRDVRPAILVHCAWNANHGEFWESPDNEDWLEGGKALFEAFVEAGGQRIVACGSCAEYPGVSAEPRRENETMSATAPKTRYGRAKLALCNHLAELKVSSAWARIFLTFGEGEDRRRLIPSLARALLAGETARCTSGTQVRDLIDVRDLGAAIAALSRSQVVGAINLGHGEQRAIAEVASLLGQIAGRADAVRLGSLPDRANEAAVLVPNLARQESELRFRPQISLRQGLADALAYWSTAR